MKIYTCAAILARIPVFSVMPPKFDNWRARLEAYSRLPICNAPKEPSGTWLHVKRTPSGEARAGCSVCQALGTAPSTWARFEANVESLNPRKVRKHGLSRLHRLAVAGSADAPSASEFEAALRDFTGKAGSKTHMLKWCLNEGLRQAQWNMLLRGTWHHRANADRCDKGATTIVLSQDVRHNRLLMRLTVSTEKFVRASFVLGQTKCLGTDSHGLAATTRALVKEFATVPNPPKYSKRLRLGSAAPKPCASVINIIKKKTHCMVTDAATDELKAGRFLSGRESSKFVSQFFENMVFHCHQLTGPARTHPPTTRI